MKEEYDFSSARKNPYAMKPKYMGKNFHETPDEMTKDPEFKVERDAPEPEFTIIQAVVDE